MNFLKVLKNHWAVATQAALWFLSVFATFIYPPPANLLDLEQQQGGTGYNFARFGLTLIVAVLFFVARNFCRHRGLWLAVGLLALVGGGALYFSYVGHLSDWTASYNHGRAVHGEQLTAPARAYAERTGIRLDPIDHATLLMQYGGAAADVWSDTAVIHRRWWLLLLLYCGTTAAFALAITAILQATQRR